MTPTITITVFVNADTLAEDNEDFTVTLSGPNPAVTSLIIASAPGRIVNDDSTTVGITADDANKTEGNGGTIAVHLHRRPHGRPQPARRS